VVPAELIERPKTRRSAAGQPVARGILTDAAGPRWILVGALSGPARRRSPRKAFVEPLSLAVMRDTPASAAISSCLSPLTASNTIPARRRFRTAAVLVLTRRSSTFASST